MADLGAIAEIINASELTLEVGNDNYIMLTNLSLHVGRTEDRVATTDAGALYSYGKGDSWFTATLLLTKPEIVDTNTYTNATTAASFNQLNQIDSNGDMNPITWKIVGNNVSGTAVTFSASGTLKEYDIRKTPEGKIEIDIFVRLTDDTIAVT